MARVKLTPELKKAISALSSKEKDRLLFRLIPKDEILVAQLEYQLLEESATVELRRDNMRNTIERSLQRAANNYYSPGYLLLDIRAISGRINRHVKITKDKYGEVELNLFMINRTLELLGSQLRFASPWHSRTLNEYVAKRILKLLKLLEKIPEDYHADFRPAFQDLADALGQQGNFIRVAKNLQLDLKMLTDL
ncbi:hypothetical protein [Flavilitoribacter nigricans]|uniref:Uncharacterized protein n=1 Tax=Flavilitoribacter nigricans (strain ATCC 23147 / DSM 23189 / NBRC 102662 / NCIMB 1420 / SS-2) TaxID=1122177 RepID=A0A2D0NFW6_FLAN2|nr:hypothetical protein [Flavilitoribacter nigricans]PHN07394.1 hypothetical protein CRP01_07125 [Flavilitoribacter nigricans DSM 23189 = NBRC 102662]